ncbi:MAG: SpoIIE family protein phosphatase [Bacteroidia bacterium]|nr:SpoIIE family protein phosphatase [Bacteroidia bacterium]
MKFKLFPFILFFALSLSSFAGLPKDTTKFKEKLSFKDVFFGSEDAYMVCYPKDHKMLLNNIILLSVASIVFLSLFLYNRSKNAKLHRLNAELLTQKNKDITDSINYAKHIQNTILPDSKTMQSIGEHFVLYKPKDIVSGDFYYACHTGECVIMAVVDCTGHGVPGAFLSLVGQTALQRAVMDEKLTNPSEIMDKMNSLVKATLKQNNEEALRDGMEVGIVHINKNKGIVEFAGATRSMMLVSKNGVHTLSGDKCTVGSFQPHIKNAPVTHTLNVQNGDMIYLFSDGITDQFGGPANKKIKKEIFSDLALIYTNDVTKQKEHFETKLKNWQGKNEQTDDMVLIGFRI